MINSTVPIGFVPLYLNVGNSFLIPQLPSIVSTFAKLKNLTLRIAVNPDRLFTL